MNLYHKKLDIPVTPLNSFNEYFCAKEQYRRFEVKMNSSGVELSKLEFDNMEELDKRIKLFERKNGTPICH